MPPPRSSPKWPSKAHGSGYCERRGRMVRFRYKRHTHSPDIPWLQSNRSRAVQELDNWIDTIKQGDVPQKITTVFAAQTEWWEVMMKKKSKTNKSSCRNALRGFFPVDMKLSSITASYLNNCIHRLETETHTIVIDGKVKTQPPYAPATIKQFISHISRFLRYCVASQWIATNPFDLLPEPELETEQEDKIYEPWEFQRIMAWFRRRPKEMEEKYPYIATRFAPNYEQYLLLWPFLKTTAMRPSEALKLRWKDYVSDPDTEPFIDMQEIQLRQTKTKRDRSFPLTGTAPQVERVRVIVTALRSYAVHNDGWLFPWRSTNAICMMLNTCCEEEGIRKRKRPVHAWRATCEYQWENEGLDPLLFVRLAGHSLKTYEKHYEARRVASDLARMLGTDNLTGQSADNQVMTGSEKPLRNGVDTMP